MRKKEKEDELVPKDVEALKLGDMYETYGSCRYCGQIKMFRTNVAWDDHRANEEATMSCNCGEARTWRKRMKRMDDAKRNIEMLCTDVPEDLIEYLKTGTHAIDEGHVKKMKLSLPGEKTIEIGMKNDDKIYVKMEQKHKSSLEAG